MIDLCDILEKSKLQEWKRICGCLGQGSRQVKYKKARGNLRTMEIGCMLVVCLCQNSVLYATKGECLLNAMSR